VRRLDRGSFELFIENEEQRDLIEKVDELANTFARRARKHDLEGSFPFENFEDLKQAGFLTLTIPEKFGGKGISLTTFLLIMERLGRGDASTALGLGWHLGLLFNIYHSKAWKEEDFKRICDKVIQDGAIINSIATEPETGSPSRGGRPQTKARKDNGQWTINGRKTWSTLSPVLDYFIVSASIEDSEDVGNFLVPKGLAGLSVEETWDSLGMRATGSHDVILKDVVIPESALVEVRRYGQPSKKTLDGGGWLLHIASCYMGVASAARDFSVSFAKEYKPNSLEAPIGSLPNVQERIGKMELDLLVSRTMVYSMAKKWEDREELRLSLKPDLATAKYVATNKAVDVIDQAMRIVGGRSLLKEYPLERYYRDVRAGLHNPPMDDVTISWLAKRALE
jgi:alkylation response protein AidB-like acyl-CoA dehydrogenase